MNDKGADDMISEGSPVTTVDVADEARSLLRSIEKTTPWRFDEVYKPEGWDHVDVRFGALRTKDGRNVIQPFEGSASVIMGVPQSVEFIINAPRIIDGLLAKIEELEANRG